MERFVEINKEGIEYNLSNLQQLVFEVTDACNLWCKYCGYGGLYEGYDKRGGFKITFSQSKINNRLFIPIWEES